MATIAIISPGAMGSAIGRVLVEAGCSVLTNTEGRSDATRERARQAGMKEASFAEIVQKSEIVMSILPPRDAISLAEKVVNEISLDGKPAESNPIIFADCNAVSPTTVKRISALFSRTTVNFLDACIIGGPPNGDYNPTIYASADEDNNSSLDAFIGLSKYGLKTVRLPAEGAGAIGDASALKMSYAGISKGITGLLTTMVLAARASSPSTSEALLNELYASQPAILQRITRTIPAMLPKAYRWVGEMHEIADFVGGGEGETYRGIASMFERVERSLQGENSGADVANLHAFVDEAIKMIEGRKETQ